MKSYGGIIEQASSYNSEEMKHILDKTREAGAIPFRTVIRRKTFGEGKKKYCFT